MATDMAKIYKELKNTDAEEQILTSVRFRGNN